MAGTNTITTKGVLIINGQQVENTMHTLKKTVSALEKDLKRLTPGTKKFLDKAEQVKRAKERFAEVKEEVSRVTDEVKKSGGIISKFFSSIAGNFISYDAITGIGSRIKGVADDLLKIADSITAVQKTSGLAQKDVEALWKSFANTNTRTSREELLKIAEIGGRLGIQDQEELRQFSEEIDKIYVALGDSFSGGLEAVTTKVGKLKNLFDETKNADYGTALNEIGSALNELGANGTASEENITDFATRIGQLPNALKPAIDATLGMGAAFEESGIDAQIASSGYSRFVSVAGNNIEGFAKQMKMTTEEARTLFNTKPEEFFLKFAESMQGLNADQTSATLKGLNLNTIEIQKSLGAAGDNANRFREMITLSGKAMTEATSIQDEFDKVNNNSAAIWEKISRVIQEFVTGGFVPELFNWLSKIAGKITGITKDGVNGIEVFRKRLSFLVNTIKVVVAALVSYRVALAAVNLYKKRGIEYTILQNTIDKVRVVLINTKRAATLLLAGAKALLTNNIDKAKKAMLLFNIVTKANPLGLLLGVIAAVVTAWTLYSSKLSTVSAQQKILNDTEKKASEEVAIQKNNVKQLLKVAQDHTKSLKERQEAVDELNKTVPEYNKELTVESANTLDATNKLSDYIEKIKEAAREKYLKSLVDQKAEELAKAENSSLEDNIAWYEQLYAGLKNYNNINGQINEQIKISTKNKEKAVKAAEKELEIANQLYLAQKQKNKKNGNKDNDENENEDGNQDTILKSVNIDAILEERKKLNRSLVDLEEKLQDELLAKEQDGFQKQYEQLEKEYERKKRKIVEENEDIKSQIKKTNKEISEINIAKTKTKDPNKQKEYNQALSIYHQINTKRREQMQKNNSIIEAMEATHLIKVNTLREKQFSQMLKTETERLSKIKTARENEINAIATIEEAKAQLTEVLSQDELSKIKTIGEAKAKLREEANKKALDAEIKFIEEKTAILREELATIVDPAMAQSLSANLDMLSEKLAKLKGDRQLADDKGEEQPQADKGNDAYKSVDLLGFSAGQWEEMYNNLDTAEGKIQAVGMAMQALANAGQMFAQAQRNANERELRSFTKMQERKKAMLIKSVNDGLITQEQYHNGIQEMERDLANKQAEMEYKQAKAEKAANLLSAIGNTALGVSKALTAGPVMGPIFAAIIGALGAVQIGVIASQPLPPRQSYAEGGFTKGIGFKDETGHEVAGAVHAGEYVIPAWLMKQPQVASVAGWLEAKRTGNNQSFAQGGAVSAESGTFADTNTPLANNTTHQQTAFLIGRLTDVLEKIDREGIEAYLIANAQNGKKISEAIDKYDKLQRKNKH